MPYAFRAVDRRSSISSDSLALLNAQPDGVEQTLADINVLARYRPELSRDRVGAVTLSSRFNLVRRLCSVPPTVVAVAAREHLALFDVSFTWRYRRADPGAVVVINPRIKIDLFTRQLKAI